MKKVFSLLLSMVLILLTVPTAFAAETGSLSNFQRNNTYTSGQFKDVEIGGWYEASVKDAYELGLVKGSSDTTFSPAGSITIAETLALASRLHSIYNTGSASFAQYNPWYQVYVDYAVANGIVAENQFRTIDTNATRAQFAEIMANALEPSALSAINSIRAIPDVTGNETYGEAVYSLYNAGILTGSDQHGTFNPNSSIQRSEVAAIVTRMADVSLRKKVSFPSNPTTSIMTLSAYEGIATKEWICINGQYYYQGWTEVIIDDTLYYDASDIYAECSVNSKWSDLTVQVHQLTKLALGEYKVSPCDNPYASGKLVVTYGKSEMEGTAEKQYLDANTFVSTSKYKFNGKTLSITAEMEQAIRSSANTASSSVEIDSIRYIYKNGKVFTNVNDFLKYFGINATISIVNDSERGQVISISK